MPETLIITVEPNGRLRFLWNDALAPLAQHGRIQIERASHVEPTSDGEWTADLSPVGGPLLGPFPLRAEALNAEQKWLNAQVLA
jgi:hypothetical protein